MRRLIPATALLLALTGCTTGPVESQRLTVPNPAPTAVTAAPTGSTPPAQAAAPGVHPVDRVVDGDTVRIIRDGKSVPLRLIGGDTPETVHPRLPVQCYGPEATAEAKRLLDGKQIRIIYDPTQGRVDAYQRDLVYVELPDGRDFMEHMIEHGFAEELTYRGSRYERQPEYRAAEERAVEGNRGIWEHC